MRSVPASDGAGRTNGARVCQITALSTTPIATAAGSGHAIDRTRFADRSG
jgi:hypothetical protein